MIKPDVSYLRYIGLFLFHIDFSYSRILGEGYCVIEDKGAVVFGNIHEAAYAHIHKAHIKNGNLAVMISQEGNKLVCVAVLEYKERGSFVVGGDSHNW